MWAAALKCWFSYSRALGWDGWMIPAHTWPAGCSRVKEGRAPNLWQHLLLANLQRTGIFWFVCYLLKELSSLFSASASSKEESPAREAKWFCSGKKNKPTLIHRTRTRFYWRASRCVNCQNLSPICAHFYLKSGQFLQLKHKNPHPELELKQSMISRRQSRVIHSWVQVLSGEADIHVPQKQQPLDTWILSSSKIRHLPP